MSQPFPADLSKCSISAILDMGVDPKTFDPWFTFLSLTQRLTIKTIGFVHMRISREWEDRFSDDTHVLEITSERRKIFADDILGYAWPDADLNAMPELTIVSVAGPVDVTLICESFATVIEAFDD